MLDVVCKDLGITYPEVLKMRQPFVLWHFYNAIERKIQEQNEKESERRFWIALMNPEAYRELERKENTPVTEAETFDTVDDYSDLKQIGGLARERMKNSVVVDQKTYQQGEKANANHNPVSWE